MGEKKVLLDRPPSLPLSLACSFCGERSENSESVSRPPFLPFFAAAAYLCHLVSPFILMFRKYAKRQRRGANACRKYKISSTHSNAHRILRARVEERDLCNPEIDSANCTSAPIARKRPSDYQDFTSSRNPLHQLCTPA